MALYLLDCTCGEQTAVADQQAGGQVTCKCGNVLSVPTLRKLRHLPQPAAASAERVARPSGTWGLRNQVASLGGIVCLILLGIALWAWATIPYVPQWKDIAADYKVKSQAAIDKLTPVQGFMQLEREYKAIANKGFNEVVLFDPQGSEAIGGEKRWLATTTGLAAAVVAVLTGIIICLLPARRN